MPSRQAVTSLFLRSAFCSGNAQTTVTASSVSVETVEASPSPSAASPASPSYPTSSHFHQQTLSRLVSSKAASEDSPNLIASAQNTVSAKSVGVGSLGLKHAQELLDRRRKGGPAAGTTGNTGFETLPISAVSAGLLPRRAGESCQTQSSLVLLTSLTDMPMAYAFLKF